MKDSFGRTIDYMRISVTDRCNLRCRYCMPHDIGKVPMHDILTFEEITEVVKSAVPLGIDRFRITGGEPLVRKGCADLVGMISHVPGVRAVTMTTNGILLKENLPSLLEHGLTGVNISLDTLKRGVFEQITGSDRLPEVLESIDAALSSGIPVRINTVLQRGINEEEWLSLARLTQERKLDVRFIELMPIGFGRTAEGVSNAALEMKLRELYPDLQADDSVHGSGPAVYVRLPGAEGSVGFISAIHGRFCGTCSRLRLTSTGKLKPCLCYGDTVDLRDVLRDREASQEDRWQRLSERIGQAVRMKPEGHCFERGSGITETHEMAAIGG